MRYALILVCCLVLATDSFAQCRGGRCGGGGMMMRSAPMRSAPMMGGWGPYGSSHGYIYESYGDYELDCSSGQCVQVPRYSRYPQYPQYPQYPRSVDRVKNVVQSDTQDDAALAPVKMLAHLKTCPECSLYRKITCDRGKQLETASDTYVDQYVRENTAIGATRIPARRR